MALHPTRRASGMEYAIRDLVVYARELEKKGVDVIRMNIGDPVAYGFDTPEHIKRALFDAVLEGKNGYCDSEGDPELREAVAERERRKNGSSASASDVIITSGITEGIQLLTGALIEQGDEMLLPGPTYPLYSSLTRFFGGTPVFYRTIEEESWKPDIEDLRKKVSGKTRAIVVVNPSNPTGAIYGKRELGEIAAIAGENRIPLIVDEIYDMLVFDGEHLSPVSLAPDIPVITLNGFSKAYLVTGWRAGYMVFRDNDNAMAELKEAVLKEVRARLSANFPVQRAMVAALRGPQDHIGRMVSKLRRRRDLIVKRLNEMPYISTTKPAGAFYVFPSIEKGHFKNDMEFVLHILMKGHVLFVHGSGFGSEYGEMHFRSVFLPDEEFIEKAMNGLELALRE
ncbi:MAG: aminotransferase class I/II-fold pyridoxal phosphate-dependent enzyme [Methanomassiliicoccales archaeon]